MTYVPTDWKLVPIKPTHTMETAIGKSRNLSASEIWEDAITTASYNTLQWLVRVCTSKQTKLQ